MAEKLKGFANGRRVHRVGSLKTRYLARRGPYRFARNSVKEDRSPGNNGAGLFGRVHCLWPTPVSNFFPENSSAESFTGSVIRLTLFRKVISEKQGPFAELLIESVSGNWSLFLNLSANNEHFNCIEFYRTTGRFLTKS